MPSVSISCITLINPGTSVITNEDDHREEHLDAGLPDSGFGSEAAANAQRAGSNTVAHSLQIVLDALSLWVGREARCDFFGKDVADSGPRRRRRGQGPRRRLALHPELRRT